MSPAQGSHLSVEPASAAAAKQTLERVALLRQLPLFKSLTEGDLEALARVVQKRLFDPDAANRGLIFSDGDSGDAVYFIVSGRVEIYVTNAANSRIRLEVAEEGGFFGEVAVLNGNQRTATAQATSPTVVLELKQGDLLPLLQTYPNILLAMFRETARRLGRNSIDLRRTTIQNPDDLFREEIGPSEKRLHHAAGFCGSVRFLYISGLAVGVYIALALLLGRNPFDHEPFNIPILILALATLAVTCIVVHSQNLLAIRESERSKTQTTNIGKLHSEIFRLQEQVKTLADDLRRSHPEAVQAITRTAPERSEEKTPQ